MRFLPNISHKRSLKGRLLVWLLVPLFFLSVAHLYSIYVDTKRTSTDLFDKLLTTLALSISEYSISTEGDLLTGDLLDLIHQSTNDKLYYKVLGPGGSFLVGHEKLPEPEGGLKKIHNHIELYDAIYLDQPVRVIAVSMLADRGRYQGWTKTFVAQTLKDRNTYIMDSLLDNLLRVITLIVIVALLLPIGIVFGLKPLKELQRALRTRDIHDLTPLNTEGMPSEIHYLALSINELLDRLTHQISLTKRFLENASHQLRTPIAALTLQCDMAMRRLKNDGVAPEISKIRQNADRVTRLANQLLHLSYTEATVYNKIKNELLDLANLVNIYTESANNKKDLSNKSIKTDLQPAFVRGNETLILELLKNLLENAEKYGGGEIAVLTYVDNNNAILDVKDQGPGIAPELRQLVTERFFRAADDPDGSGLGLAIVKEITIMHGGSIEVTSGDNQKGTCIRCRFPIAERKISE